MMRISRASVVACALGASALSAATEAPWSPPLQWRDLPERQATPVAVAPTQDDCVRQLEKWLREDTFELSTVRWSLETAARFRERFRENPWSGGDLPGLFSGAEARRAALACWMAGEEELAYRMLFEGWVRGPDEENRFDPWFAEYLWITGQTDRALRELQTLQPALEPGLAALKRFHVLRAAGRVDEALGGDYQAPYEPAALLELAVEKEVWTAAIKASANVGDSGKREVVRSFIAIVSNRIAATGHAAIPPNRMLRLLGGDPFGFVQQALRELSRRPQEDLRELGQDAILAAAYEAWLTNCLATGEALPFEVVADHFRQPDLLPDRQRAVRLAIAVGAAPRCDRKYGGSVGLPDEKVAQWGHQWIAADVLVDLGRGDAAFATLRPFLLSGEEMPDLTGWGYGSLAGYRHALTLAAAAWPEAGRAEQLERLAAVLGRAEADARARGMLELAAGHGAALSAESVLQWLDLAFRDLAAGSTEDPAEVLQQARAVFGTHAPTEKEQLRFEGLSRRFRAGRVRNWGVARAEADEEAAVLKFDPPPATVPLPRERTSDFIIDDPLSALKGHWDAKQAGFVMLDGLAAVRQLLEARQEILALRLMQSLALRLCLDDELGSQRCGVERTSVGFNAGPSQQMLICARAWNFPADWLPMYAGACWRPKTGYADDQRLREAAAVYRQAGLHEPAARLYRLYLLRRISPEGDDPLVEPGEVVRFVKLDATAAAARGDREGLLRGFRNYLRLSPYHPEGGLSILATYVGEDRLAVMDEARKQVERYWSAKLLEIPASDTYAHWRKKWVAALSLEEKSEP